MTTTKLAIATNHGEKIIDVTVVPRTNGIFAVHRNLEDQTLWTITHVPTGWAIPHEYCQKQEAIAIAQHAYCGIRAKKLLASTEVTKARRAFTKKMRNAFCSGFTLIELLVVVAIIGALVALLIPAVQAARESARCLHCQNNLRQIGLAMHNYLETHESFPCGAAVGFLESTGGPYGTPTGTREGWRVFLLPFLEEKGRHNAYDFTESLCVGVDNRLSATRIASYECPSDGKQPFDPHMQPYFRWRTSNYCGVAGSRRRRELELSHCGWYATDGVLHPLSGVRLKDIPDGLSQTLLVGEQANWLRVWTAGAYRTDIYGPNNHYCVFACKNVTWALNTDPEERKYNHAKPDQNCLFNDIFFSSRHGSGVNFVYADGHIEYLNRTVKIELLKNLATRDGREIQ